MISVLSVYTEHDLGACLLQDGQVTAFIQEERLTRVKHGLPSDVRNLWSRFAGRFGYFPWASVRYCLEAGKIGLDDLDAIVVPHGEVASILPMKDRARIIVADRPKGGSHHYMHALSTFYASPFERATVMVVDGSGSKLDNQFEAESAYFFQNRQGDFRELFKNRYPVDPVLRHGIGFTYEYVSVILGFVSHLGYLADAGKTMGLAPYGRPHMDFEKPWIVASGHKLDFTPFHQWLHESGMAKRINFASKERAVIQAESQPGQYAADLAYKVQMEIEKALLHLTAYLAEQTDCDNLCLAGGVHLNSVANGLIAKQGLFKNIFIQPAADDTGQALGLAYYGHQELMRRGSATPIQPMTHAYGGITYPDTEIEDLLQRSGIPYQDMGDALKAADDAAFNLAQTKIIGWFQGGSEVGPRALGHRSILADPRQAENKDILNKRVKFRESFRPFAPSALASAAAEVFDMQGESPYMLQVVPVREAWQAKVPAITHVDGTARVQTVTEVSCPIYHRLIRSFAKETGIPLVLNTSFNLRGMPIIETPEDAFRCFVYTEIDVLYMGRFKINRPDPSHMILSLTKNWRLVTEQAHHPAQAVEHFFRHNSQSEIKLSPIPGLSNFIVALDGHRTVADAFRIAEIHEESEPLFVNYTRVLLRKGILQMRLDKVTFHPA